MTEGTGVSFRPKENIQALTERLEAALAQPLFYDFRPRPPPEAADAGGNRGARRGGNLAGQSALDGGKPRRGGAKLA